MKDTAIKIRVASDEKDELKKDATAAGFDNTSAYLLNLARVHRPRRKR